MKLFEFFNEDNNIIPLNKAAPDQRGPRVGYPPYFSDDEAERAAYEWNNQAQIDQDDGVLITSEDGKNYRIFRHETDGENVAIGDYNFEPGEVYLVNDDETNPKEYVEKEGHPDVEDLLHYHSKQGYVVGMEEGTRCWKGYKKKGTKKMFGKTVPNCVKNEMYNQDDFDNVFGDRKNKKYFEYLDDLRDSGVTNMYGASPFLVQDFNELDEEQAEQILVRWMRSKGQTEDINENSPGDQITLYNVKGEKKIYTIDKVSNNGGMIVSGNGLDRIIVNQTLDAVTFNIKDPNYKIQAPGFQMQGRVVRDISPAVLDNAMMTIRNKIKTAPKNQGIYRDLVADYFALKFKKDKDQIDSMQQENFADGKKKGKSKPGRVKKAGASCNGSVTSLRKRAKNSSGEKSKMYHWCANMKSGRKKK